MKIIIIGAGIGGLSAAIALRRVGLQVSVYESKSEMRIGGAGLGVGANAARALQLLGLGEPLRKIGRPMEQVQLLSESGKVLSCTKSDVLAGYHGSAQVTVLRADLLEMLLQALGSEKMVNNGKKFTKFEQDVNGVKVWFEDGSTDEGSLLIGADGIRSAIRGAMLPAAQPKYSGYTCWRSVVQADANLRYDPNLFTETWGREGRFGIVPLAGNRIYWFACVNAPAGDPTMRQMNTADLAKRYARYHNPIPELLALSHEMQVLHHDIEYLPPIKRFCFGRTVLIGDAAHAMTPNMGQGAGQAIEDALYLAEHLKRAPDVQSALSGFERERVKRTGTITRMSGRIGRVAQLEGRLPIALRNALMPLVPVAVKNKQLKFLYKMTLDG